MQRGKAVCVCACACVCGWGEVGGLDGWIPAGEVCECEGRHAHSSLS